MEMFKILMYVQDPETPLRSGIMDRFNDPYISLQSGILDMIKDLGPNIPLGMIMSRNHKQDRLDNDPTCYASILDNNHNSYDLLLVDTFL